MPSTRAGTILALNATPATPLELLVFAAMVPATCVPCQLLGSDCALSGIHPNVAQTIVHMGVDLSGVQSFRTLRDALQHHVRSKAKQQANGKAKQAPKKEQSTP